MERGILLVVTADGEFNQPKVVAREAKPQLIERNVELSHGCRLPKVEKVGVEDSLLGPSFPPAAAAGGQTTPETAVMPVSDVMVSRNEPYACNASTSSTAQRRVLPVLVLQDIVAVVLVCYVEGKLHLRPSAPDANLDVFPRTKRRLNAHSSTTLEGPSREISGY